MDVTFTTWLWGDKYSEEDVLKLYYGIKRNFFSQFRFLVCSDRQLALPGPIEQTRIEDAELMGRGCFCRLRMFDPEWQGRNKLAGRIINLDLDAIIVGPINETFYRSDDFVILKGVNAVNPNPFNCSVMLLQAGKCADVWRDFSLEAANKVPYHEFPDDQGWIWHKLPAARYWTPYEGIYGFKKPGWPRPDYYIPAGAKIIAFIGSKKPQQYFHLDWVKRHWRIGL